MPMDFDALTLCLRCPATALHLLPESTDAIAFLECRACARQYARKPGAPLTFRWGHPISLALYGVIFEHAPLAQAQEVAAALARKLTGERIAAFVSEIALELERPTQDVREIVGNVATEAACREFLCAVLDALQRGR